MLNVKYVVYKCLFLHACVYTLKYFVASMGNPGQSVIDGTPCTFGSIIFFVNHKPINNTKTEHHFR